MPDTITSCLVGMEVNGTRHKGHREKSYLYLSCLLMFLTITEATVTRRIDENDECGTLSAALTIDRSLSSVVFLVRLLPS